MSARVIPVAPRPAEHASDPRPAPAKRRNDAITEDSVALDYNDRYAGRLRFCHTRGKWFEWRTTSWREESTDLAFERARQLARERAEDAEPRVRAIVLKTNFARGVETFARSDRTFAVTAESWDRDPWLLGTPGGTVDLRDGRLRPARPEEGITRETAVAPAERGDCPMWLRFLEQATGDDEGLIRFLRQWAGYCLTGITREHKLVFVHGGGGNGKSVLLNAMTGILSDYAKTSTMDTFSASRTPRHLTELAMLDGARLVTASETEAGQAWAEARIKSLTGGDKITANFMRCDHFTYVPQFKLTVVGNNAPALRNVDDAMRRRINVVPFTRRPATPDPHLEDKLRAEWPAILRWMIDGCLDWQAHGLIRPAVVSAATADYLAGQDVFGQWIEDECEVDTSDAETWDLTADLYQSWCAYATKAGEATESVKSFAEKMKRRGFVAARRARARAWTGIRLARRAAMGNEE